MSFHGASGLRGRNGLSPRAALSYAASTRCHLRRGHGGSALRVDQRHCRNPFRARTPASDARADRAGAGSTTSNTARARQRGVEHRAGKPESPEERRPADALSLEHRDGADVEHCGLGPMPAVSPRRSRPTPRCSSRTSASETSPSARLWVTPAQCFGPTSTTARLACRSCAWTRRTADVPVVRRVWEIERQERLCAPSRMPRGRASPSRRTSRVPTSSCVTVGVHRPLGALTSYGDIYQPELPARPRARAGSGRALPVTLSNSSPSVGETLTATANVSYNTPAGDDVNVTPAGDSRYGMFEDIEGAGKVQQRRAQTSTSARPLQA